MARNRGLAEAKTPYVMFLDDDDQLWPGALSLLAMRLERQTSAVAAIGARQAWFVAEHYRRREPHPRRNLVRDSRLDVIFGWCVTGGQVILRTGAARSIGGFSSLYIPCEDREFWFRLGQLGPFVFIPETVLTYRQHPGQVVDEGRIALRNKVASNSIADLPVNLRRQALRLRRAKKWFDLAEESMMKGMMLQGLTQMLRGFGTSAEVATSPLLGEWVLRWLLGRGLRYYWPAHQVEQAGTSASVWRCPPGALAFHPDAPVVAPGVKAHPIVVQFSGGIGNQLFQYAAALVLASQTGSSIQCLPTDSPLRSNEPSLEALLGILPKPRRSQLIRFGLLPCFAHPRLRRRWRQLMNLLGLRQQVWAGGCKYRETIERPLLGSGLLLAGYFQSLDWASGSLDTIATTILRKIPAKVQRRPDVIAISLRTGADFKQNQWTLPNSYYQSALLRIPESRSQRIWVIGDCERDARIMASKLSSDGWNVEQPPSHGNAKIVNDFWNLASARTIILSNSTFAWWSAVIGDYYHPTGQHNVIFPDPWLPAANLDLLINTWIRHSYLQPK